jgi:hypothetical protein
MRVDIEDFVLNTGKNSTKDVHMGLPIIRKNSNVVNVDINVDLKVTEDFFHDFLTEFWGLIYSHINQSNENLNFKFYLRGHSLAPEVMIRIGGTLSATYRATYFKTLFVHSFWGLI